MITLYRISCFTQQHIRSMTVTRMIHIESDPNEKIVPLSKFDLSKPLIGRTTGTY